ncbi:MAG: hypothetical protein IKE74_02510 [Mogibacterium sp.]|nr:hypothetical protein [Mogibacterium sp.]
MHANEDKRDEGKLLRSDKLLLRKFSQYLVPTMITYAALSLNEFVDSMLVSNLLGSEAMAIVNIGVPVVLLMAAAYALLGQGGATLYAIAAGRRDQRTAGESLTASMMLSLVIGFIIMIPGIMLLDPVAGILCKEEALRGSFDVYLRVLLLLAPLEVMILTLATFLPAAGYPGLSTAVNVVANIVNIMMDVVYIKVFHLGVEGAAWATLTGYIAAGLLVAAGAMSGRVKLYISRDIKSSMGCVREIFDLGKPDAMNQIGLSMQFAVCNRLAMAAGGANGIVALSFCMQSSSVMSVFVGAVIGASVPLMAVLHGQSDYRGEAGILKTAMISQFVVSLAGTVLMFVFAPQAAALYNIKEAARLAMSVHAFRIYVLMFVPRYALVVYYRYLKVIGLTGYSTVLSALDSFAAVIPVAWIMVKMTGIDGLWWSFPLTAVLLIILTLVCNGMYAARSGGRLRGPLLIEYEKEGDPETVMDATITRDSTDISLISEKVQEICEERGLDKIDAMRVAMAVEEIAVYTANRQTESSYADVLVRIYRGNVEIDFRSMGEVFDPNADYEGDIAENVQILRSIVSDISNEYILGMNSTRITIKGKNEDGE